jgi:hypothetical protein
MAALLFILLVLLATYALAYEIPANGLPSLLIHFEVDSDSQHTSGIYWVGHEDIKTKVSDDRPWFGNHDLENLLSVIPPGAESYENVIPGSEFTVRSSDLYTRIRLQFDMNHDSNDNDRPYSIRIVNLATDDRMGPSPIEVSY